MRRRHDCLHVLANGEGHLRGMAVVPECREPESRIRYLLVQSPELTEGNCSHIKFDTAEPLERAMHVYERQGYRRSAKVGNFFGMPLIEFVNGLRAES